MILRLFRALALGLLMSAASALPAPLSSPVVAEESTFGNFTASMADLQAVYVQAGGFLAEANALDTRISVMYFNDTVDERIDSDLEGFGARISGFTETSKVQFDRFRSQVDGTADARQRSVITNALGVGEILLVVLGETPAYLSDLLAAVRTGDSAAFGRLSRQSMMRTSALLRTEAMMARMQQEHVRPSHPSHALLESVGLSNEAMAIFSDTAANIFVGKQVQVDQAADAMRAKIAAMRVSIDEGRKKRTAMSLRLFIPSFTIPALADFRKTLDTEFVEAFEIESEIAGHLADLANEVVTIYDGNVGALEALDARTQVLVERRIANRSVIIEQMKQFTAEQ